MGSSRPGNASSGEGIAVFLPNPNNTIIAVGRIAEKRNNLLKVSEKTELSGDRCLCSIMKHQWQKREGTRQNGGWGDIRNIVTRSCLKEFMFLHKLFFAKPKKYLHFKRAN
jgi:hypothetical protein